MKIVTPILLVALLALGTSCRSPRQREWIPARASVVSKSEVIDTLETHCEWSTEVEYRILEPERLAGRTVSYGYAMEDPEIQKLKVGDSVSIEVSEDYLNQTK